MISSPITSRNCSSSSLRRVFEIAANTSIGSVTGGGYRNAEPSQSRNNRARFVHGKVGEGQAQEGSGRQSVGLGHHFSFIADGRLVCQTHQERRVRPTALSGGRFLAVCR